MRINKMKLAPLCLALGIFSSVASHAAFYPQFDPAAGIIPFPNNLLFNGSTTGTINAPVVDPKDLADPRVALNGLDGFSTVAPLTATFSASLNANSVHAGNTVRVFEVELLNPFLNPKTPAPFAIANVIRELRAGVDYQANLLPQDPQQTTLNIQPLRPLPAKTGYLVVLTSGLQDSTGASATASPTYALTKLTTALVDASGKSVIPGLSDVQARALEPLRQLVNNQESAAAGQGVNRSSIVLSWTLMTQSIDDAFVALDKNLHPLGAAVQATGANTKVVGLGLPGFSDIYAGALALPYYLDKDQALIGYWKTADGAAVTRYNPLPTATATLKVPVLMTVPNAHSGQSKPATGWPVVIFQHGITRSRTDIFTLADALSFEGYVTVAMDMPLHGVTDTSNPFYLKGMERTFDLDMVNNASGAAGADGKIDASGTHFINLKSLLTTRDNMREAAQDLRQLALTLPYVDLNADGKPDLDAQRLHFVGHSLGGIVGSVFLGIDEQVSSATLGMAGGGLAHLLDGSPTFGPVIAAGLASAGLVKDTPAYETFLNIAQTAVDSGDAINYGAAAASLHPLHLIEVVGSKTALPDQVVPNTVENAPLSGTEPLAQAMGLQATSRTAHNRQGLRSLVRFTEGDHSSLISPVAAVGATAEMQGQMIDFLNSAGTRLEIIYQPVIQR